MKQSELDASLLPKLTPEFMATFKEAINCVGWGCDITEVIKFYHILQLELRQDLDISVGNITEREYD